MTRTHFFSGLSKLLTLESTILGFNDKYFEILLLFVSFVVVSRLVNDLLRVAKSLSTENRVFLISP